MHIHIHTEGTGFKRRESFNSRFNCFHTYTFVPQTATFQSRFNCFSCPSMPSVGFASDHAATRMLPLRWGSYTLPEKVFCNAVS